MLCKLKTMLREYAATNRLEEKFSWDFSVEALPPEVVTSLPKGNAFEKNIALKHCLTGYLGRDDYPIEYWIIRTWGGIKGFRRDAKNNNKIRELYSQLKQCSFSRDIFEVISSLSKVASFFNPNAYAIYDSRAIFSLNWLLLKSGAIDNFFHMPSGRNREITKYDMETIIRLKCGDKPDLFLDNKIAYFKYCNLLKELSPNIWEDNQRKTKPFYLEMLLFILGPGEIVNDIKGSMTIDIRTKL
jgi:hypothetical protein